MVDQGRHSSHRSFLCSFVPWHMPTVLKRSHNPFVYAAPLCMQVDLTDFPEQPSNSRQPSGDCQQQPASPASDARPTAPQEPARLRQQPAQQQPPQRPPLMPQVLLLPSAVVCSVAAIHWPFASSVLLASQVITTACKLTPRALQSPRA